MKKKIPDHQLEEIMPVLMGARRRLLKEKGPSDKLQTREFRHVCEILENLHKGLELNGSLAGTDYFLDREKLTSYTLYDWVVHYQQGLQVLNELPTPPRKVLDVCSGPGAFAMAALRHGANEVTATDQNMQALELASEIAGRNGYPLKIRKWNCKQDPRGLQDEKFDLIILGHALNELFPKKDANWLKNQVSFVQNLLSKLTPDGYLCLVENSDLETNTRFLNLRDQLVENGAPIQAPCVWKGLCPALQSKNSPCYAQREFYKPYLVKEIQRVLNIKLGSLKFSYLIVKSPQSTWPELDNKNYYRVISPPLETYNGKRYYLCGTDGKKNLGSRVQPVPEKAKAFEYIKRGELITFSHVHEHLNNVDLIAESELVAVAACSKPLPQFNEENLDGTK